MTLQDPVILEFLEQHDLELPPKPLYRNLNRHGYDIGYSTVRNRVRELEEQGYLASDDLGYYSLTDRGQSWLSGALDDDLPNGSD
jgi:Fur family ferric uptake transcriptional regulator